MRRWAPVIAALWVLVLPASVGAETTIEAKAGIGGWGRWGTVVPVEVRVEADRLLRGSLHITPDDGIPTVQPIEVPGGSTKVFLLSAPLEDGAAPQHEPIPVRLADDDGRTIAEATAPISLVPAETELVGLLPGTLAGRPLPGGAPLAVDAGTARFVAITPELLEHPFLLRSLSSIVVAASDLEGLGDDALDGLWRWTTDGGHLLVGGSDPNVLPEGVRPPAGAERVPVGTGEVRLVGDAVDAGRWAGLVEPTQRANEGMQLGLHSSGWMPNSFLSGLGDTLPSVDPFVTVLVVYAIAAGPVLYLLLRRSRREIAMWLAVPLGAIALTGGSYAGSLASRSSAEAIHRTVIRTSAVGAVADTLLAVAHPTGGSLEITLPEDAAVVPGSQEIRMQGLDRGVTASGPGDATATIALNPGEVGVVQTRHPVDVGGTLDIDASVDGSTVRGTVRNGTGLTLQDARVFLGKDHTSLGRLEPGDERPFSLPTSPGVPHFSDPGETAWGSSAMYSTGDRLPDGWSWGRAGAVGGPDLLTAGVVAVAGWTDGHRPEVRIPGTGVGSGSTLVLGRSPVSGEAHRNTVRRELVRGVEMASSQPGADDPLGAGPSIFRYVLPAAAAPSSLVLHAPEGVGTVEVWRDGAWDAVYAPAPSPAPLPNAPPQIQQLIPGPGGSFRAVPPGIPPPSMQGQPHRSTQEIPLRTIDLGSPTGDVIWVRVDQQVDVHAGWAFTVEGRS